MLFNFSNFNTSSHEKHILIAKIYQPTIIGFVQNVEFSPGWLAIKKSPKTCAAGLLK